MVRDRANLDNDVRLRSRATRLRWAVEVRPDTPTPEAAIRIDDDGAFLARFTASPAHVEAVLGLCENLALHVWLLTTLSAAFERAERLSNPIGELRPALEYLAHLWNPSADLAPELQHVWQRLDDGPQLSWEWNTLVARIRDRVALLTAQALDANLLKETNW
jgi:hypothetical protein